MENKQFDWSKFDKKVNLEVLKKDVQEASKNSDFAEIPVGRYDVEVKMLELGQSKIKEDKSGGDPMMKVQFKILDGEFKDQLIFYNGVMQPNNERAFGFQVHKNNELLRSIYNGDQEITFESFQHYNNLIMDVAEEVVDTGLSYCLTKSVTKKGYDILEVEFWND